MVCSSPRVKVEATSSFPSTFMSASSLFDRLFSRATTGAKILEKVTRVGTIQRATPRAARVTAAFLGTISPKITCR